MGASLWTPRWSRSRRTPGWKRGACSRSCRRQVTGRSAGRRLAAWPSVRRRGRAAGGAGPAGRSHPRRRGRALGRQRDAGLPDVSDPGGAAEAVTVVATCRSDEAHLEPQVAAWLAHVRERGRGRDPAGRPVPWRDGRAGRPAGRRARARGVRRRALRTRRGESVLHRAAGGPRSRSGGAARRAAGPARTAAGGAGQGPRDDARAVLAALAIAARPLTEEQLSQVAGLGTDALRAALRELAKRGCWRTTPPTGGAGSGTRCWPRRSPTGCCPASGTTCTSARRRCSRRAATGRWPPRQPTTGRPWAARCRAEGQGASGRRRRAGLRLRRGRGALAAGHRAAPGRTGGRRGRTGSGRAVYSRHRRPARVGRRRARRRTGRGGLPEVRRAPGCCHRRGDPRARGTLPRARDVWLGGQDTPGSGLPLIAEALRLFDQAPPSAEHAEALFYYGNFLSSGRDATRTAARPSTAACRWPRPPAPRGRSRGSWP